MLVNNPDLFKIIIENSHDSFVFLDRDLNVIYASPQITEKRGISQEDVIGQSALNFIHSSEHNTIRNLLTELSGTPGKTISAEIKTAARNNEWIWEEIRARNLLHNPDVQAIVCSISDISQRKEAEETNARLREELTRKVSEQNTILENANIGIALIVDRKIMWINRRLEETLGYAKDELIGKSTSLLYPSSDEFAELYKNALSFLTEDKTFETVQTFIASDGTSLPVRLVGRAVNPSNISDGIIWLVEGLSEKIQMEKALSESQTLLGSVLDSTHEMIWTVDVKNFGLLTFNKALADYFHRLRSIEISLGMTPDVLLPTKESAGIWKSFYKKTLENGPFTTEYATVSGSVILLLRFSLLKRNDEVWAISVFGEDVTEKARIQRELIERNKFIEKVLEKSPIGFAVRKISTGESGYFNGKFIEIYNISDASISNLDEFYEAIVKDPVYREEIKKRVTEDIQSGDPERMKWENVPLDPSSEETRFVTAINIPLVEQDLMVSTVQDVTEKVRALEKYKNAEKEALSAYKFKSTLLANLSHEFRTPLNGILGLSEIMMHELQGGELQELASAIQNSGKRLNFMLNSIMLLSQLSSESFQLRLSELNFDQEILPLINECRAHAVNRKLQFTYERPEDEIVVSADKEMLQVVTANLLDNAVKFTAAGSISVSLKYEEVNQKLFAVLSIKDTGIGIAGKDQELIFQEFTQISEGYARSHEGVGIGLTIAKKMAGLLNGSIELESAPGQGSLFRLRLPAVRISSRPRFPAAAKITSSPRILVVEDNFINALVIKRDLKGICTIDHADRGTAAIRMAQETAYDAVLMDINLGAGISGVETAAIILGLPGYNDKPIAAVTGYTSSEDREDFFRSGFTHFLPKPFDKNEIINLISEMLS